MLDFRAPFKEECFGFGEFLTETEGEEAAGATEEGPTLARKGLAGIGGAGTARVGAEGDAFTGDGEDGKAACAWEDPLILFKFTADAAAIP